MSMFVHTGRSSSSSSTSSRRSLKLLVTRGQSGNERVVYAEANKEAADYLFSLLSWRFSISTIINVVTRNPMAGCVRNLYRSVQTFPDDYICHHDARAARDALLWPTASSNRRTSTSRSGFVRRGLNYMVWDDLRITPPSTITAGIAIRNNGGFLREIIVPLGDNEGTQIVNTSMVSNRVLTDVYLRARNRRALGWS